MKASCVVTDLFRSYSVKVCTTHDAIRDGSKQPYSPYGSECSLIRAPTVMESFDRKVRGGFGLKAGIALAAASLPGSAAKEVHPKRRSQLARFSSPRWKCRATATVENITRSFH